MKGEKLIENIEAVGVQRHNIVNNLQWANLKKGGKHKANLTYNEIPEFKSAYERALVFLGKSDTLMAIGKINRE